MLVFLRHAQRGDNEHPTQLSQIPYDPPITESTACSTIQQTSSQLTEIFKQNGIKYFRILSSKFLRCLMTASRLQGHLQAAGFGMLDGGYWIDDRVCQYLREDWYEQYPLDNLIMHTQHIHKYIGKHSLYTSPLTPSQSVPKKPSYPQNYVKFHQRVTQFKKQLKFPEPGCCLIIVTHGFVVRELSFKMHQLPKYQNQIKYCGYAAYVGKGGQEVLVRARL